MLSNSLLPSFSIRRSAIITCYTSVVSRWKLYHEYKQRYMEVCTYIFIILFKLSSIILFILYIQFSTLLSHFLNCYNQKCQQFPHRLSYVYFLRLNNIQLKFNNENLLFTIFYIFFSHKNVRRKVFCLSLLIHTFYSSECKYYLFIYWLRNFAYSINCLLIPILIFYGNSNITCSSFKLFPSFFKFYVNM